MAALACLSRLLFLRVSEALSITPAGLASDSVVLFVTTKVGGHREVRRPLYGWGQPWVRFLRAYAQACCSREGQPLVRGGVEAVEKIFASLLRDSPYADHRWHSLWRAGAAAAFHRSPNVPYFGWWGRWRRLATALEYALGYSDPMVVGALELPWPVGDQTADGGRVVLLADLWGDAMCAKSEKSIASAVSAVPVPVQAGPAVSLARVAVAAVAKDLEDAGSDSDSTAVSSASSKPTEPWRLPGVPQLPPPRPHHPGPFPESSRQGPSLRPGQEESG